MPAEHKLEMVQSYTRVRLALGLLGLALPVVLILGGIYDQPRPCLPVGSECPESGVEPTISDFYHTTYRDIFVGSLCAIGVFLISYRGYSRGNGEWINDDWLATIAGLAAFGLAFFPNEGGGEAVVSMLQNWVGTIWAPRLHYMFALVFFLTLAGFCFFKFPKSGRTARCKIYRGCGWGIVAALVATAIAVIFKRWIGGPVGQWVTENSIIFYLEAVGVWAFALSWIVKSRADLELVEKMTFGRIKADRPVTPSGSEQIDSDAV